MRHEFTQHSFNFLRCAPLSAASLKNTLENRGLHFQLWYSYSGQLQRGKLLFIDSLRFLIGLHSAFSSQWWYRRGKTLLRKMRVSHRAEFQSFRFVTADYSDPKGPLGPWDGSPGSSAEGRSLSACT